MTDTDRPDGPNGPEPTEAPDAHAMAIREQRLRNLRPAAPWQPGQSGNPLGRRVEQNTVRALARKQTKASILKLAQIRDNARDAHVVIEACRVLLEHAWGKPPQAVFAAATTDQVMTWERFLAIVREATQDGESRD